MKSFLSSLFTYLTVLAVGGFVIWQIAKNPAPALLAYNDYSQPTWGQLVSKWRVRAIDTQVVSRHWLNVPRESIATQAAMLKHLEANYIAVATPYDRVEDMRIWVEEIHEQGMNVWFRAHWNEWEGDDKAVPSLSASAYLQRTTEFIKQNKELFKAGDAFTVAVEPEQVGVGLGKRFANWEEYRIFILNQILSANKAFEEIGMKNQIHTNWISTNGWVAKNSFTKEFVDKLGLITVDHYPEQTKTIGSQDTVKSQVDQMSADLDELYKMWNKPILLGEWGYQIHQDVTDQYQATMVDEMMKMLVTKKYIIGMNYWVHMGHYSRIIGDTYGADLKYRPAADVLRKWFIEQSQ